MSKIKWLLTVAVVLLSCWYVFLRQENQTADDTSPITTPPSTPEAIERSTAPESTYQATTVQSSQSNKRSATEIAVVDDWMRKVGYRVDDREAYKHYTDEQLINLIEQGDINAMYEMGSRKLDTEGIDAAIPFAQRGIVYGSLNAIKSMGNFSGPKTGDSLDVQKKQLMESFAYYSLLGMRGDTFYASHTKRVDLNIFKNEHNLETVFTPEDEAWIDSRAKELYDQYQAERNKLGLGDFDNEVPKEVKEFLGM